MCVIRFLKRRVFLKKTWCVQGKEWLIQVNGSPDFLFGKETSHELSYGKQLSTKVGQYIHKFLKKFVHSFLVLMRLGETPVPIPNTTVKT